MDARCPELPLLPGYSFNLNVGKTRFHTPHYADFIAKGIRYINDPPKPGVGSERYPSVYARGEAIDLPPWLVYDRQVLVFDGFFQEPLDQFPGCDRMVRRCRIYFYLEDGTVKVTERQVRNSGLAQGCLISRQRIRFPNGADPDDCYDILDFNVGKALELFGRTFILADCDLFTRTFLNRLGIPVPPPLPIPADPYISLRQSTLDKVPTKKSQAVKKDKMKRFLELDGLILTFDGYWDDTKTQFGYLHLIQFLYYLADDTVQIKDVTEKERPFTIVKRSRLPKESRESGARLGGTNDLTLLNVVGPTVERSYYIRDASPADPLVSEDFITDADLTLGAVVDAYGRKIVLTNCDDFTKRYYSLNYGIEDFSAEPRPPTKEEAAVASAKKIEFELPPYNGFGTHEDSAINCRTVNPASAVKSYRQFYAKDKEGYNSRVLRFIARMISKDPLDEPRSFVVSYYLVDDTVGVFEKSIAEHNIGGGMLIHRRTINKPGEEIFASKPPATYNQNDFYLGAVVELEGFKFLILGADEYALRYMEIHSNEFPKSNFDLVLEKLREGVRPAYKNFVAKFFREADLPPVPYSKFRDSIKEVLGDQITEQEILTLARRFSISQEEEKYPNEILRRLTHDELRRRLFDSFDRLREGFLHRDELRTGSVDKSVAYSTMRGAKVPLEPSHIQVLLQKFSEDEKVNYDSLIEYLNYTKHPTTPIEPINLSVNMSWIEMVKKENRLYDFKVDIKEAIDALNLEGELKQQCQ